MLEELASILDGQEAARYMPLIGDMRKIKRFVNALLLVRLGEIDLGRTDFHRGDLVRLLLLHLNFPGLFRRIYAEESGGRSGAFSVKRDSGSSRFENTPGFDEAAKAYGPMADHLLRQLFDVGALGLAGRDQIDDEFLQSRACFNEGGVRNLQEYLELIVRFSAPEPRETFILYQGAVSRVREGTPVLDALREPELDLSRGERAHDRFWRVLVNESHRFSGAVADGAIDALVASLPRYSTVETTDRGLRQTCVYSLARLLDIAGWGGADGRLPNTPGNVIEIARRIFGSGRHQGKGLIERMGSPDRGVLGWHDLILFRLTCSTDRQAQLFNLSSALIADDDPQAPTSGLLSDLAKQGMRRLSQVVFRLFEATYIAPGRNFLAEVDRADAASFMGEALDLPADAAARPEHESQASDSLGAARSAVKSFVLYQLCNSRPPTGTGVGCGFYDEVGAGDEAGIAKRMNDYAFGVCFDVDRDESNRLVFADHCLSQLSRSFGSSGSRAVFIATRESLVSGFDRVALCAYWKANRYHYEGLETLDRRVVTHNYVANYRDDLRMVFKELDAMLAAAPDPPDAPVTAMAS